MTLGEGIALAGLLMATGMVIATICVCAMVADVAEYIVNSREREPQSKGRSMEADDA